MPIGQIKWFSSQKGYGFLETPESKQDVFVHFSDIQMSGYKTLKEKSWVYFVLEESDRGPCARQISPVLSESATHDGVPNDVEGDVHEAQDVPVQADAEPADHQYALAFEDDMSIPSRRFNKRYRHAKSSEQASMV